MDEVAVDGPPDRALDAHQAVLFGPLENGIRLQDLLDAAAPVIGLDPADVLATSEAPTLEAESAQVEAVGGPTPGIEVELASNQKLHPSRHTASQTLSVEIQMRKFTNCN